MLHLIKECVKSCEQCIREARIDGNLTLFPLHNPNELITAPEDTMQIDLVPDLPPSVGYENIVIALDVFFRCLFTYPISNQDTKTNAKVIINIMAKHAYLPTTLIPNKDSSFVFHLIQEVAGILGITQKHTTTKHARTIGLLEQSHGSTKQSLMIKAGERRSLWHIYVNIVVLNYNTSYHTNIGCDPRRVFHGRVLYNFFGHEIRNSPTATTHSYSASCFQGFWPNGDDLPKCSQKCHAGSHQTQSLLREKGTSFQAQRSRLPICLTAESRSSSEWSFIYWILLDWPLHYWKGITEKQLSGTQNWHQQDASVSSHANTSIHTPPTVTWYTKHATRKETWSGREP